MIKIINISISFVGVTIFEDVNIICNRDDKIGLIGRNGSGKSTLFKLLIIKLEADDGIIDMKAGKVKKF